VCMRVYVCLKGVCVELELTQTLHRLGSIPLTCCNRAEQLPQFLHRTCWIARAANTHTHARMHAHTHTYIYAENAHTHIYTYTRAVAFPL
jgi:hypothetical protein